VTFWNSTATERQKLARAKERSEAAFRTLVEAAPCLIVMLRHDHTILYFSPFAEKLTGYSASEVVGKDYRSLFVVDPRDDPLGTVPDVGSNFRS